MYDSILRKQPRDILQISSILCFPGIQTGSQWQFLLISFTPFLSICFYFCLSPSFPFSHLVHLFIIVYIHFSLSLSFSLSPSLYLYLSFSLSVSISLLPILSLSLSLSLFLPLSSGIPISFSRYIHIKICITRHRFFLLHHLFLSPTSFPLSIFVSIYQIHEIKLTVSLFHSLPFPIHKFERSLKTFLLLDY